MGENETGNEYSFPLPSSNSFLVGETGQDVSGDRTVYTRMNPTTDV